MDCRSESLLIQFHHTFPTLVTPYLYLLDQLGFETISFHEIPNHFNLFIITPHLLFPMHGP